MTQTGLECDRCSVLVADLGGLLELAGQRELNLGWVKAEAIGGCLGRDWSPGERRAGGGLDVGGVLGRATMLLYLGVSLADPDGEVAMEPTGLGSFGDLALVAAIALDGFLLLLPVVALLVLFP